MAESLLTLRKKANELGIQNYAKYSKEELAKLIEQKEAGIETYTDPEYIASDEDVAKEEKDKKYKLVMQLGIFASLTAAIILI